ncbi:hypothetical protein PHMEG_0009942 [Phytophthora megakarya]|uniref:Uncharacterized protein n=1 Tax=Phytophthora megakarya TaxID=4795 RepID=A0A225WGN4_9STRA|nr:hypothetical protein PHMEG_0009942 [Phytophthora megakarya]
MNEYLRSKCSSEQQLLNELAKLLGGKDVASRKMADVLRALTFFYTSAARGSRIPQSLLSGLCTLLPQLKDKKENILLKDEHQRIARIALCLLARLIDQFEIQKEMQKNQEQSADPADQVLTTFLLTLETTVMTPSGLLLPRQRATLRVYAQLCRVFCNREQLVTYSTTLLQQSPVLAYAESPVDAKGKRLPPPTPAQFGAVAGACHALRFHTAPDEQVFAVDKLTQLAFMIPATTASRHAAKTMLSLLTSSNLNENRPSNAVTVAKAIELYMLKARPRTLLGGDSLTSVYLLRLCETSCDTAQQQSSTQNPALQGYFVSNALAAPLQEMMMDIVHASVADNPTTKANVVPAILLAAIEETLQGTSPETSFREQPNWGSKCIFELVTTALLSLLPAAYDQTKSTSNTVTLHRVCRAVQFVAERFDATVLQLSASPGQMMVIPAYLSQLTMRIRLLTEHSNAFVSCEALRAYVWLLPRWARGAEQNKSSDEDWVRLFRQLETLPSNRIQPERRAAIAWTLFRRCVTTVKTFGYEVETPLLSGCLRVVLTWFRGRPCMWHAALLSAIWHTALRECLESLGDAVFSSINDLLDYQCPPQDSAASDCLVVKQCTLQFLSHREGGMKYAARSETWSHPLLLRLTKQALLETCSSQRLSKRALSQLCYEAQAQNFMALAQQVNATLTFLQQPRYSPQNISATEVDSDKQSFTLYDDPFSDVTAEKAAPVTDEDPFSDFRSPDERTTSRHRTASGNMVTNDPFADAARVETAPGLGVTSWGNVTNESVCDPASDFKLQDTSSFGTSTWSESTNTAGFIDTKTQASMDSATSVFSNWGDEPTVKEQDHPDKGEGSFFGNFSASEVTTFGSWEAGTTSNAQQERFDTSFNTESAEFTSWPTNNDAETLDFGAPTTASSKTNSFTIETPSATTVNTEEEATFSSDFGTAATDFGAPSTDFSAPATDFGPASDFGPPSETPAFGSGAAADRHASFGGDAKPVDVDATATTSSKTNSFTIETPSATT